MFMPLAFLADWVARGLLAMMGKGMQALEDGTDALLEEWDRWEAQHEARGR